jgi:hypothetical protein
MPASSGLRSRPQVGLMRHRSGRRVYISGLAEILPRFHVLPILLVAGLTLAAASLWTYAMYSDEAYAEIDAPSITGTIKVTN